MSSMFMNDAALLPIGEEESFEIVEVPTEDSFSPLESEIAEANLEKAKGTTAALVHDVEASILEMQNILGKTKMGSATLSEREQLLLLNTKLSALKIDIDESKTTEKDAEIKVLRSKARSKVV